MRRVYLVGCGKQKLSHAAPAREIYTGSLFRKALAYAEAAMRLGPPEWGVEIYVLSAQHGLVHVDDVLAPYDLALSQFSEGARYDWGLDVVDRLAEAGWFQPDVEAVVLAGAVYLDALLFGVNDMARENPDTAPMEPPRVVAPLTGLGIGKRLAWLTNETNRLNAA